jgi:hypothetical protein
VRISELPVSGERLFRLLAGADALDKAGSGD